MTQCPGVDSAHRAASLWLAATQLYARESNGPDCAAGSYAWATIRASVLHALSQQVDSVSAEPAAELLLVLLSETDRSRNTALKESVYDGFDAALPSDSAHGSHAGDLSEPSELSEESLDAENGMKGASTKRGGRSGLQSRSPFFAQTQAPFLQAQSKWMEDEPIPHIPLPLVDPSAIQVALARSGPAGQKAFKDIAAARSLAASVISLRCVAPKIRSESSASAQRRCLASLSELRQRMPTSSVAGGEGSKADASAGLSLYGDVGGDNGASLPPPLEVVSAKIVKSESHLLLERVKTAGFSAKVQQGMSMATFFNPYAKKKAEGGDKAQLTLVAAGEERSVLIEFANRLSVPLEIPSCHLQFKYAGADAIEAPPLSFVVPAKTNRFTVHFPVIIVSAKRDMAKADLSGSISDLVESEPPEADQAAVVEIFDLSGLQVTILNRCFTIPFRKSFKKDELKRAKVENQLERQVPYPASVYQRSSHNTKPKKKEEEISVRLEAVPAQPILLVSFKSSQTPLEDNATVPVHLSDGEIYTIPAFRLENDFGPSGMGKMVRLQIVACGLPGLPDEVLFDTDALAAAREEEEDDFTESEDDDTRTSSEGFEELMEFDGLPPLKMKALAEGLSLRSINSKSKSQSKGSVVTFQVAATHDMGNQLANGGNVRIRFRYRGLSSNPAMEIWRKREVSLRIVRVKGPRISSLTFRSDLSWGSAYSDLCHSLARQQLRWNSIGPKWDASRINRQRKSATSRNIADAAKLGPGGMLYDGEDDTTDDSILHRVGLDRGVHVSGDEVVVLMAVANETNSTIILSNRKGLVGGFEGSPMPTVRVTSGVSVKIPVVIPRIDRLDENCDVMNIAAELISRTALQWESESTEGEGSGGSGIAGSVTTNKKLRQGRVRIPSRCLREIIDEHKSFASRICRPPVSVQVTVAQMGLGEVNSVVLPGTSIEVFAEAGFHGEDILSSNIIYFISRPFLNYTLFDIFFFRMFHCSNMKIGSRLKQSQVALLHWNSVALSKIQEATVSFLRKIMVQLMSGVANFAEPSEMKKRSLSDIGQGHLITLRS